MTLQYAITLVDYWVRTWNYAYRNPGYVFDTHPGRLVPMLKDTLDGLGPAESSTVIYYLREQIGLSSW